MEVGFMEAGSSCDNVPLCFNCIMMKTSALEFGAEPTKFGIYFYKGFYI